MKKSRVVETKYKGYLIKPAVSGFKVYRKDYYIGEYSTRQIAMNRIDKVAAKRSAMLADKNSPGANQTFQRRMKYACH